MRITARKIADGRIEFGLQQRQSDGTWGVRQLPRVRFFPTTAEVDRWLRSSYLTLTLPQATGRDDGATASPTDTASEPSTALPSASRFSAVSAGGNTSCGLVTDGSVACWGANRLWWPSGTDGPYSVVSVGFQTCGLRTDGTMVCERTRGGRTILSTEPHGQFSAVSVGGLHCGLRTDGTVECWGDNIVGQTSAPAGQFSAVSAGFQHSCGLRTDGTIECWGTGSRIVVPAGQFSAVSAGGFHTCGLRSDATIECWGVNENGQTDVPEGQFSAVSAGGVHTCGLRTDGTIKCWGSPWREQIFPPEGQFSAVSVGIQHSCGLRTDGTIECWGDNSSAQRDSPGDDGER